MKFKLDANIGARGRQLLQSAGHDVATASEQGLAASSDALLASVCVREQRVLVTLDTDFANPFVYPPENHAGIVVIRVPPRGTVEDIETALCGVLRCVECEPLDGRLVVVDEHGRVRAYQREKKK